MSQSGSYFDGTVNAGIETITGNTGGQVGPVLSGGTFTIGLTGTSPLTVTGNPGAHTLAISIDSAGYVASITGTANQISVSPTTGAAVVSLTNGVSIGSYQATVPPTGGMIMPGQFSVGASSITSGIRSRILAASTDYTVMSTAGDLNGLDGSNSQFGWVIGAGHYPTNNASACYSFHALPAFSAQLGNTITDARVISILADLAGNQGTISQYYGMYITDLGGAGTITAATNLRIDLPSFGTTKICAAFGGNVSIGASYVSTAAPTNGLIVQGQSSIGISAPNASDQLTVHTSLGRAILVQGTQTGQDSEAKTIGIGCRSTMNPGDGSTIIGINSEPIIAMSGGTGANFAAAFRASSVFTGNAGGIANYYGFYYDGGAPLPAGSLTFIYGAYISVPVTGTNRIALFSTNHSVGASYATSVPPTNGSIIQGQVGIGTSAPAAAAKLQVGSTSDSTANVIRIANSNAADANPVLSYFASGAQENTLALENGFLLFSINPASYTTANLQSAGKVSIGPSGGLCVGSSYINTTPPTNGLIVQGNVGINTTTFPTNIVTTRLYVNGSISLAASTQLNLRSDAVGAEASGGLWIGYASGSLDYCINNSADAGTPRAIAFTTSSNSAITGTITNGVLIWPLNGGITVGTTYAGARNQPSTGGIIVEGVSGFGTNSANSNTRIHVTPGISSNIYVAGTYSPVMSAFGAYDAVSCVITYQPSGSSTDYSSYFRGVVSQPVFISPSTKTFTGVCTCFYAGGIFSSNVGTITNAYGYVYDGGSSATGTVTNAYGGYFQNPNHGTNRAAVWTENLSVGYLNTSPPSSGAIISGQVGIGTISPASGSSIHVNKTAGGSVSVFASSDGGANNETLQFRTAFASAANPIIGSILGSPDNTSGGRLIFSTARVTSGTLTEAMRIDAFQNVGIGVAGPGRKLDVRVTTSDTAMRDILSVGGNFQGANDATTRACLVVEATLQPTFSGTITNVFNTWLYPNFAPGSGCTISNGMGLYIDTGAVGGAGSTTNSWSLYVNIPAYGTTKNTAFFGGTTAGMTIEASGILFPTANKTLDMGKTGSRFNTMYNATNTTGTSRFAPSQKLCPTCSERMMRGTGTIVILGETCDVIPCWCDNELCSDYGHVHMDKIKHLPPARLAERRAAPKIEFLGFKVCNYSGNSRGIQVKFRYIDKLTNEPHDGHIENSTFLTDIEYAQFKAMTKREQFDFLTALGQREWDALEETRLLEAESTVLEQELNSLTRDWANTDLLDYE